MKRDMTLIRELLLRLERDEDLSNIEVHSAKQVNYQLYLLQDAGFINAELIRDHQGDVCEVEILEITWAGQEFLDAIRDEGTLKKALGEIGKRAGTFTAALLLDYIQAKAKEKLGVPI